MGSSAAARLRPFVPVPFGRYTLLAPLSTGGMGKIYLARLEGPSGFSKLCVIKKILPELAEEKDFVSRFVDEAKILVKLSHGAIAQVLEMGLEEGAPYIALEFVDGKDLRKIAGRARDRQSKLPLTFSLYVMSRVLDALAYAHRKKDEQGREIHLVHRDVSPQNVLVSYEGEVKVIDFGLAKSSLSAAKTHPSVLLGKFRYMAPEQARHQPVDRRSDVYSAGICLWELIAGKNPFDEVPPGELMSKVSDPAIPPLRQVVPGCPASVEETVAQALEIDPARRFQSAEAFRGRVLACLLEVDPVAGSESASKLMHELFGPELETERRLLSSAAEQGPVVDGPIERRTGTADDFPAAGFVEMPTRPLAIPESALTPLPIVPTEETPVSVTPVAPEKPRAFHGDDTQPSAALPVWPEEPPEPPETRTWRDPAPASPAPASPVDPAVHTALTREMPLMSLPAEARAELRPAPAEPPPRAPIPRAPTEPTGWPAAWPAEPPPRLAEPTVRPTEPAATPASVPAIDVLLAGPSIAPPGLTPRDTSPAVASIVEPEPEPDVILGTLLEEPMVGHGGPPRLTETEVEAPPLEPRATLEELPARSSGRGWLLLVGLLFLVAGGAVAYWAIGYPGWPGATSKQAPPVARDALPTFEAPPPAKPSPSAKPTVKPTVKVAANPSSSPASTAPTAKPTIAAKKPSAPATASPEESSLIAPLVPSERTGAKSHPKHRRHADAPRHATALTREWGQTRGLFEKLKRRLSCDSDRLALSCMRYRVLERAVQEAGGGRDAHLLTRVRHFHKSLKAVASR